MPTPHLDGENRFLPPTPENLSSLKCPHCSEHRIVSNGAKKKQLITDVPENGRPTFVYVNRRRFLCKGCGKTFMLPLAGVEEGRNLTTRLTAYIEEQMFLKPFVGVARETGVSECLVRSIFKKHLAKMEAAAQFKTPDFIALEPVTILNKTRYLVCNLRQQTVINLLESNSPDVVGNYLKQLPNRHDIKFVLMDMNYNVRQAVWDSLPLAQTIFGSRHLIGLVSKFFEEIRKLVRERSWGYKRRLLAQDKAIFKLRQHELSAEQNAIIDKWRTTHIDMLKAYALKNNFCDLFDLTSKFAANKAFEFWSMDMEVAYQNDEPLLSLPNWTIDGSIGEFCRWFEHPSIRKYEQAVVPLMEVLSKFENWYSINVIRARLLSIEDGRSDKGIKVGSVAAGMEDYINTIYRIPSD
ncbi:MAG: hypothetical protein GJT30_07845 [Geobacter sp.]|nr:hypothetical protein [Geobacter sp.]